MRRVVAAILALGLVAGCDESPSHQNAPEPTSADIVNGTHTQIIQLPDGFRNVAFTCFGTNGVYVTSRGAYQNGGSNATPLASSVFVLASDPHCAQ